MMNEKLVSVCVNSYNSADTITETLNSIINQTYKNLQIIVVDDCSTDNTVEIVKKFNDDRIELHVLPENGGVCVSNNKALKLAKGEYISHVDADDMWKSDMLEKQVGFLEEHSQYGACFSFVEVLDERLSQNDRGGITAEYVESVYNIENRSQAEFVRLFYDSLNHLSHSSFVIRKDMLSKLGYHDLSIKYLHDFDYWTRLVELCPIYIYPEKLNIVRVRTGSNSDINENQLIAHNEEFERIIYKLIDNCPDEMFLEAFRDRLKFQGEHTKEEIELEKAFLLLNGFMMLPQNKVMGIRKFDELFKEEKYINAAREKFNFTLKDFHNLHTNKIYYNQAEIDKKDIEFNEYKKEAATEIDKLNRQIIALNETNAKTLDDYNILAGKYNLVANSFGMKITKPARALKKVIRSYKSLHQKTFPDGRKVKARIMLYGYFGHNVGDDLFFDMLFKRYPDTMFYILHTPDYAPFCQKYGNVKFYDATSVRFNKINALGNKLGIFNLFEKLLLKSADAALHIGGSVYQQVGNWQTDIKIRSERTKGSKRFYTISNNFGPYKDDSYITFWRGQFKKWTDICFRDKYSYDLFKDLKNVRYAPDLLLSYKNDEEIAVEKKVAFSVIDTRLPIRGISEEIADNYESGILKLIKFYIQNGYKVSILGFCAPEQDNAAIDRLISSLSEEERKNVSSVLFNNDLTAVINEIKSSEKVIATRFHAMILGYIFNKQVLTISYSKKVQNVIEDLELTDNFLDFDTLNNYTAEQLDSMTNSLSADKILELRTLADAQFDGMDKLITKKNGIINK